LEDDLNTGIDVLESQAGYIELPDFEPGSNYMPFSSQLDFLGNPIPYWYYVSGNNLEREQVPSVSEMESQIADFVEGEINGCELGDYYDDGFEITKGAPEADVTIRGNEVEINLNMNLDIKKEDDSALIDDHKIIVNSELGKLYDSAVEVYQQEQNNLFLEERGVDILNLYAPVDGVEISCSPEIWQADEVFDELQEAIEANTGALKSSGKSDDYFVVDSLNNLDSDLEVRFLNSKNWPGTFEVNPSEGSLLVAEPVGNQPGLGAMGFCYIPYHFVYDMKYPVLVQVYSDVTGEIFQFPMAVVIQGNKPRVALDVSAVDIDVPELCTYKNTQVEVRTFDTKLNPVEADISYECFTTKCDIGKTTLTGSVSSLKEEFPQCVNGFITATAEGFKDTDFLYSTTEEGSADIIMDRVYEKEINLNLDGKVYTESSGIAIITFTLDSESASEINSKTIVYPTQKKIELTEGQYEVQVYIYRNSSLKLESSVLKECVNVPQSGVGGIFGLTKEECFDIEIPTQTISNALSGGGKENYYILESELENSDIVEINSESLPLPVTLDKLQENYILFEDKELGIIFR